MYDEGLVFWEIGIGLISFTLKQNKNENEALYYRKLEGMQKKV
jgi:hypothetical protein